MNFSKISFGEFELKIIAIFIAVGVFLGLWRFYRGLERQNLDKEFFVKHLWQWILGGFVGGRIFGLLLSANLFQQFGAWGTIMFWAGGFHFLGFVAGFLAIMIWQLHQNEKNIWRWVDQLVLPLLVGVLVADLGAFVTGAWYGRPTSMPWGVSYNTFGVEYVNALHPVGLYGFLAHYWIFKWIQSKKPLWKNLFGKTFLRGGLLFCVFEFVLQFFRGDSTLMVLGVIRIDLLLFAILSLLLFILNQRQFPLFMLKPPPQQ